VFAVDEFGPLTIRPQAGSGWRPGPAGGRIRQQQVCERRAAPARDEGRFRGGHPAYGDELPSAVGDEMNSGSTGRTYWPLSTSGSRKPSETAWTATATSCASVGTQRQTVETVCAVGTVVARGTCGGRTPPTPQAQRGSGASRPDHRRWCRQPPRRAPARAAPPRR
jgi:hypothetical protein